MDAPITNFQSLKPYQERFLSLLLTSGALRFGSFQTKSGRQSPYFFNAGAFDSGSLLKDVSHCYGACLRDFFDNRLPPTIHLYGPAYKGITLAAALAMELSTPPSTNAVFTYNRKESKDHGEGGKFVGRKLSPGSSVYIVEDVLTGGTSVRESLELLRALNVSVAAVIVGVDRQEKGQGSLTARAELEQNYNIKVLSLLTLDQILIRLSQGPFEGQTYLTPELTQSIAAYRKQYG
jgi:orotate phosphoribosyltransferase